MRRRRFLRLGVGSLVAAAGCSSGGRPPVSMTDGFEFDPARLTVHAGATVRWTNDSDVPHTVTAETDGLPARAAYFASGGFETERAARADVRGGLVAPGAVYEHTFETPGTYEYVCLPHEGSGMVGTVVVRS